MRSQRPAGDRRVTLTMYPIRLPLRDPFTISRGTITHQDSLVVALEHGGITGYGEVTANDYYGHTLSAMSDALKSLSEDDLAMCCEHPPENHWQRLSEQLGGDMFSLSALDMASHDWHARSSGSTLWHYWGLTWNPDLQSSFTIGIDSMEEMRRKLDADSGWDLYKIKLGTEYDLEIIRQLRQCTTATFRVDANCAWSAQQTIDYSKELRHLGVQFIEQPLPRSADPADKQRVFEESSLPIIADEDCQTEADLKTCFEFFHGINVKLCKCGGLTPARKMLTEAKRHGKLTMVGCMVESPIGISGAAQLAPLLDFADLDGANLISDSPAHGVEVMRGHLKLPVQLGTGAELVPTALPHFLIQ
ncbi:L-alanine-DL-glutamate epimerase [Rhodopirellula islandica]|uniref:Dipeptide epimerase n=1 Tax=Rhodopirellula islandica TaxID=595434 RepID=A0A0J1B9D7_RHOIS|nr:dipeptide epimerase [Rhodopirellula islandica]KLU03357.1 L-alanine-DL-glutamate epimerase [Rhodopirellula islandica]